MPDLDSEFERFASELKAEGLSQREISKELGKSQAYLRQKLCGDAEGTRMDVLALRELASNAD